MATSTLGASPGVRMSWSEMWTWKAETPARVPGRRPDLGREVGEGGRVVAEERADRGELGARQLHAVAGVTGEPDDDPVELGRLVACRGGHSVLRVSGSTGAPDRPPGATAAAPSMCDAVDRAYRRAPWLSPPGEPSPDRVRPPGRVRPGGAVRRW